MNRKIQLIEKELGRTATGSEISTENLVCEPWANMKDISGAEDVEGKVRHLVNRAYVVRYNPVIKSKGTALILIDEGKKYEIIHIIELGRNERLEIRVKLYE